MADLPDLRSFVRAEAAPTPERLVVRGGPDSAAKLRMHAERLRRAYLLDGAPVLGISVFAAFDDIGPASLDAILAAKLSTYRVVHLVSTAAVSTAGFDLVPTFGRPHMTLLLDDLDEVETLVEVLGPPEPNPQYGEVTRRSRRRPR